MNIDPMTLARVRLALQDATRAFLFDPNVTLIDFGYRERNRRIVEDELTVRLHVTQKLRGAALEAATQTGSTRPIPPAIRDFPTDVQEATYRPHLWSMWGGWRRPATVNTRATRADPMRGGISISDERHSAYGTLGGKVIDRATGAELILSNWHVLAFDWSARPGQRIRQPGRLDGGTDQDSVARLTRDAMAFNLDAAVAALTGNRSLINDQLGLGSVTGTGEWELGRSVVKSGRRSGITRGYITAIEGIARIRYGRLHRIIREVMTIEPLNGGQISAAGDSGSWWLDAATRKAIGLHFAGSDVPERALALNMRAVLDALNVDLAV